MARNEEKAQSMLNRFITMKNEEKKKPKERHPFLSSECRDLAEADKWRQQIMREIGQKVTEIQNEGLGEHRLRNIPHVSSYSIWNRGEIDAQPRWYSVLTAGRYSGSEFTKHINPRNKQFLGNQYESTAAASESTDAPTEKYEYQAESAHGPHCQQPLQQ